MGVKSCNRAGCENIMCDSYSEVTGYICNECKHELEDSEPTCVEDVIAFMSTMKPLGEEGTEFSLEKLFEK